MIDDKYYDGIKATKVRITRCYLVEIVDKDGNELKSDYCFTSRDDAKNIGNEMKEQYNLLVDKFCNTN